jgi:hypothetical protein
MISKGRNCDKRDRDDGKHRQRALEEQVGECKRIVLVQDGERQRQ